MSAGGVENTAYGKPAEPVGPLNDGQPTQSAAGAPGSPAGTQEGRPAPAMVRNSFGALSQRGVPDHGSPFLAAYNAATADPAQGYKETDPGLADLQAAEHLPGGQQPGADGIGARTDADRRPTGHAGGFPRPGQRAPTAHGYREQDGRRTLLTDHPVDQPTRAADDRHDSRDGQQGTVQGGAQPGNGNQRAGEQGTAAGPGTDHGAGEPDQPQRPRVFVAGAGHGVQATEQADPRDAEQTKQQPQEIRDAGQPVNAAVADRPGQADVPRDPEQDAVGTEEPDGRIIDAELVVTEVPNDTEPVTAADRPGQADVPRDPEQDAEQTALTIEEIAALPEDGFVRWFGSVIQDAIEEQKKEEQGSEGVSDQQKKPDPRQYREILIEHLHFIAIGTEEETQQSRAMIDSQIRNNHWEGEITAETYENLLLELEVGSAVDAYQNNETYTSPTGRTFEFQPGENGVLEVTVHEAGLSKDLEGENAEVVDPEMEAARDLAELYRHDINRRVTLMQILLTVTKEPDKLPGGILEVKALLQHHGWPFERVDQITFAKIFNALSAVDLDELLKTAAGQQSAADPEATTTDEKTRPAEQEHPHSRRHEELLGLVIPDGTGAMAGGEPKHLKHRKMSRRERMRLLGDYLGKMAKNPGIALLLWEQYLLAVRDSKVMKEHVRQSYEARRDELEGEGGAVAAERAKPMTRKEERNVGKVATAAGFVVGAASGPGAHFLMEQASFLRAVGFEIAADVVDALALSAIGTGVVLYTRGRLLYSAEGEANKTKKAIARSDKHKDKAENKRVIIAARNTHRQIRRAGRVELVMNEIGAPAAPTNGATEQVPPKQQPPNIEYLS